MYFKSGLHCWQLAGKTNVCGVYGATGSPAYYSLAPQVLTGLETPAKAGTNLSTPYGDERLS